MNLPISLDESNAGLVPPAVATVLMGAGGGFLLVFQVRNVLLTHICCAVVWLIQLMGLWH